MDLDCTKCTENYNSPCFDATTLFNKGIVPTQFIWPQEETAITNVKDINLPIIDLGASLAETTSRLVADACTKHGFFVVTNHGVDKGLIADAHKYTEEFFMLPFSEKQKAQRLVGEHCGYASSFIGRFSSKLPWKETLSLRYSPENCSHSIEDYVECKMGESHAKLGTLFQRYAEEMSRLSLTIMEILAASLGVRRTYFREFYEDNDSVLRLNYYPPCAKPDLTLGTGPHSDPTSLTILHQDQVPGLHVLVDGEWRLVRPIHDLFVVNIGDTFMAMTNGKYRSCMHRAVVNSGYARKSLAFFLSPKLEKIVSPPRELVDDVKLRAYPDFTWAQFLEFTQKFYRADMDTLNTFCAWLGRKS